VSQSVSTDVVAGQRLPRAPRRSMLVMAGCLLVIVGLATGSGVIWLQSTPLPPEQRYAQALSAMNREDWKTVEQTVFDLREFAGFESHARLLRACVLGHRGFQFQAIDELARLTEPAEVAQRAKIMTGECWYRLGRHVECQQTLNEVLSMSPDSVEAHRWLAASHYDLGSIHDAIYHLEQVGRIDPDDHRPHRLLGLIYKDYEKYEEAVFAYEQALRLKGNLPDWEEVRHELAECQLRLLRHQDAIDTLRSCPDSAQTNVLRAECWYALGDKDAARIALALAQQASPNNLPAMLLEGTLLMDEAKPAEAVATLERAANQFPYDYTVHFKLAQAYEQARQPKHAALEREAAEQVRKLREEFARLHTVAWDQPRDPGVRIELANLARRLGRSDLAEVWMKSAAALAGPTGTEAGPERSTTGDDVAPRQSPVASPVPMDGSLPNKE
jgi:tetratricopeptide (TPR) repeat protein